MPEGGLPQGHLSPPSQTPGRLSWGGGGKEASSEAATTGKAEDTSSSRGEELTNGTGSQNSPRTNAPISCHSPPLVLTNTISQLKGWGVVPLKATKAVAGRLQYHLANWEGVTKDRRILDTVKGYLIEFTNDPTRG